MHQHLAFIGNLGPVEIVVLLLLVLLIFGGTRVPAISRSLGRGIFNFKKGISGITDEVSQATPTDKSDVKR